MLALARFFENQFDDNKISRQTIRKFTEDHLKRLSLQNTDNLYDTILNNTEARYQTFFGALKDRDTAFALQQSRTKSMNNVLQNFQSKIRLREGLVKNYFSDDSAEYLEFFPQGLTEYSNATLENAETLMNRVATAFTNHTATIGAATATEFAGFVTQFNTARGTQLTQKGKVSDASEAAQTSRTPLEEQLTYNLLIIASNNIGNAAAAASFFDQSILTSNSPDDDEDTPPADGPK